MYDLALNYIPENNFANDLSWARRKGYGQLYGETYMDEFKDELLRMFREGTINDGNKMNPGKMRETLMNMFPHKFSIPSELEIKKFITSEAQKHKKKGKRNENPAERRGRKSGGTTGIWTTLLNPLIEENANAKPEEIYELFIKQISVDDQSRPPDLPMNEIGDIDKKKIKSKINQERAKIKKRAQRDLI